MTSTPRPVEAIWSNAKLYRVDLYNVKWPRCGTRLVWAVVGRKWVRVCIPIELIKFRMSRNEWDRTPHELFEQENNNGLHS
jgi:hypothetical protein